MKCLVNLKYTIDYAATIRVKPDGSNIETSGLQKSISPFDANALQAALELKQAGKITHIIAVTMGQPECIAALKTAYALGADQGVYIEHTDYPGALTEAKLLHVIARRDAADIVLLGKQAIDDNHGQTGPMLAGLMNAAQATFVTKINVQVQRSMFRAKPMTVKWNICCPPHAC